MSGQLKIDVAILNDQMGLQIADNNNGYLSADDFIISQNGNKTCSPDGENKPYQVTEADVESPTAIEDLLNRCASPTLKFRVVDDESKAYLASYSTDRRLSGYWRLYGVNEAVDTTLIKDGGIRGRNYSTSLIAVGLEKNYGSHTGTGISLGQSSTEVCNNQPDQKRNDCFTQWVEGNRKEDLKRQAGNLKEEIKFDILQNNPFSEKLEALQALQNEIASLRNRPTSYDLVRGRQGADENTVGVGPTGIIGKKSSLGRGLGGSGIWRPKAHDIILPSLTSDSENTK